MGYSIKKNAQNNAKISLKELNSQVFIAMYYINVAGILIPKIHYSYSLYHKTMFPSKVGGKSKYMDWEEEELAKSTLRDFGKIFIFECKTFKDYDNTCDSMAEGAEEPFTISVVTQSEYELQADYTRDRIVEAYENGNGSSIYV